MAIINQRSARREINLSGPEGNAYCLLGHAKNICKQTGQDYGAISTEMMAGDYRNLVLVFDKHFGELFDIIDENGILDDAKGRDDENC